VSPYLDEVLDLEPHERAGWLGTLATRLNTFMPMLENIIRERVGIERRLKWTWSRTPGSCRDFLSVCDLGGEPEQSTRMHDVSEFLNVRNRLARFRVFASTQTAAIRGAALRWRGAPVHWPSPLRTAQNDTAKCLLS
jgi:hypothetical protein